MNSLETKVVERIATCLKEFDTYEIYKSISQAIMKEVEDKDARDNILRAYEDSLNHQCRKLKEAQGWLTELINNK